MAPMSRGLSFEGRRDKRQTVANIIAPKIGQAKQAAAMLSDDYSKGFSPAMVRTIFDGLDCDKDGAITLPDLQTWFNSVLHRRDDDNPVDAQPEAAAAAHDKELTAFLNVASKGKLQGFSPLKLPQPFISVDALAEFLGCFHSLAFEWDPAPMPPGKRFRNLVQLTFKELDADQDGEVSADDFNRWQRKLPLGKLDGPALAARALAADVNNDGTTVLDELEVLVREDTLLFAQLDTQRRLNDWLRRHRDRTVTTPEEFRAAFVLASMRFSRYADEQDRRLESEASLAQKIVRLIDGGGDGGDGDGDGRVSVPELQRWLGRVAGLPVTEADLSLLIDPKRALRFEASEEGPKGSDGKALEFEEGDANKDGGEGGDGEEGAVSLSEEDLRSLLAEPALLEFTSLLDISVRHELSLQHHRKRQKQQKQQQQQQQQQWSKGGDSEEGESVAGSVGNGPFFPFPPPPPEAPSSADLQHLFQALDADRDGVVSCSDLLLWVAAACPGHSVLNETEVQGWEEWQLYSVERFRSPTQKSEYGNAVTALKKFDELHGGNNGHKVEAEGLAHGNGGSSYSLSSSFDAAVANRILLPHDSKRSALVERLKELAPVRGLSSQHLEQTLAARAWEVNMVCAVHPIHEELLRSVVHTSDAHTAVDSKAPPSFSPPSSSSFASSPPPSSSSSSSSSRNSTTPSVEVEEEEHSVADYVLVKLKLLLESAAEKEGEGGYRSVRCQELQRKISAIKASAREYRKVSVALTAGLRLHLLATHKLAVERERGAKEQGEGWEQQQQQQQQQQKLTQRQEREQEQQQEEEEEEEEEFSVEVDPSAGLGMECGPSMAVASVVEGGQASKQGVTVGCAVKAVDGAAVGSRMEFKRSLKLAASQGRATCVIRLERPAAAMTTARSKQPLPHSPSPSSPTPSSSTSTSSPASPSSSPKLKSAKKKKPPPPPSRAPSSPTSQIATNSTRQGTSI